MKNVTKILVAALAACMVAAALVACSSPTPTSVTTDALNAVKSKGLTALADYCDGDAGLGDSISAVEGLSSSDEITTDQKAVLLNYAQKMFGYDFTVSNEQVSGDTATVTVAFTAYDCGTPFKEAFAAYIGRAFTAALASAFSSSGDATDTSQYTEIFFDELKNQVTKITDKSEQYTGTITLAKKDGAWKITSFDDEARNGLTGGLYGYLGTVADSLSSLTGSSDSASA